EWHSMVERAIDIVREVNPQAASLEFFFSSRRRHTGWPRDWSSDVCSSDLYRRVPRAPFRWHDPAKRCPWHSSIGGADESARGQRSEERRVGKECRSRRAPHREKKEKKDRAVDGAEARTQKESS